MQKGPGAETKRQYDPWLWPTPCLPLAVASRCRWHGYVYVPDAYPNLPFLFNHLFENPDVCSGWSCDNNKCVQSNQLCNSENNCGDGSDELNCGKSAVMSVRLSSGQALLRHSQRFSNTLHCTCACNLCIQLMSQSQRHNLIFLLYMYVYVSICTASCEMSRQKYSANVQPLAF